MYNMWSPQLQLYLSLRGTRIDPLKILTSKQIYQAMQEAVAETVTQYAWELASTHNLSIGEAQYIAKQLIGKE